MKMILVVALALAAVAVAAPPEPRGPEPPKTLRSQFDQQPNGQYESSFETENGIKQQKTGEVKQVPDEEGKPRDVVVVRGFYSYTDPEGKEELINYYADETGYHADGPSVPKGPEAARRR